MPIEWVAFLTRYRPMAVAIARSLVHAPAAPEDIVQEAALALHRALQQDPVRFAGHEHARNYFLRTVRNLALKSGRAAGREQPLEDDPPARDEADPAHAVVERQRALARLLLELDPAGRDLIVRRFLEHQTLARVAAETQVPISTLHDREKALLAELRRRLEPRQGAGPGAAGQEVAG